MNHTLNEIITQPSAWQSALQEAEREHPSWRALLVENRPLIFAGCGSTWYLAEIAAALFRRLTGRLAAVVPGGEMVLYSQDWLGDALNGKGTQTLPVLIALSRSGSTTETVRAAEIWKSKGGHVLAVTNYPDSPLASLADAGLFLPAGQERSVVQTRSFASMLVGLNALAVLLGGHHSLWEAMQRLPELGERLIQRYHSLAQTVGNDLSLERFYFLGGGLRYGLAREVSLKMKEMSLSHSEPFPFLEFRHGPMSMVNAQTLLFGLLSDENRSHEQAVLNEMQALGGRVLSLGEQEADVAFHSGLPESARLVLYLPVPQLIATYRSLAKGLNPDQPHNLTAVVMANV